MNFYPTGLPNTKQIPAGRPRSTCVHMYVRMFVYVCIPTNPASRLLVTKNLKLSFGSHFMDYEI